MAETASPKPASDLARTVLSILACAAIVAVAAGATYVIFTTEPTAESEAQTRRSAALVETIEVRRADHRPELVVLGQVQPARDIVLAPRVSGQVVGLEPGLVPGGIVARGEPLVRIDPADFEQVLVARESALAQVKAELAIEEGRQLVARQEYELLGAEIAQTNAALVLREPQIAAIRARMLAAEAAVAQARLDLERTTVSAPFDAQVLARSVDVGSQVSPGDELARLVGIDEYWIVASVPMRDLPWIAFADADSPGARVRIRHATAWPAGAVREASVARLIGTVDERSRLAQVLVTVPDPIARAGDAPPLILGTIVELRIEGNAIEDVVRLEREHLRQNDTVWLMADGVLRIRPVEVIQRDGAHVYVKSGLDDGDLVVTTSLATVADGLLLRRRDDAAPAAGDAASGALR